jgi:RecA-family ATPase
MVASTIDHDAQRAAESEQVLLGALMISSADAWPHVKDAITAANFSRQDHRLIFAAIAGLIEEAGVADPFLVVDRLGADLDAAGGSEYIAQLYEDCPSAKNAKAYVHNIRAIAGRGKVVELADAIAARARSNGTEEAAQFGRAELERIERDHSDAPLWPAPIALDSLLSTEPSKPRMIVEDWLPCGYATMLAGHGGAGKSSIALHLAASIAQGRAWCALSTQRRRVVYLSCEDRSDVIHWRLARICHREGWSAADLTALHIRDLVGYEAILYRLGFDGLVATKAYRELTRVMAEDPSSLLILDGVSDTYGGNENDRGQVKTFVNALVRLVSANGAVLLVHHVNKLLANAAASTEGYSGSTGWHNSVRARWYLRPETETDEDGNSVRADGKLLLELQKSNLGRADQQIPLRWDDDAHMFVATTPPHVLDASLQDTEERAGIMASIREVVMGGDYVPSATTGQRTALHVLAACRAFPIALRNRSGKRRFWRHIESLRRSGVLIDSVIHRAGRHDVATISLKSSP